MEAAAAAAAGAQWHHREVGQNIISTRQWVQQSVSSQRSAMSPSEHRADSHSQSSVEPESQEKQLEKDIRRVSISGSPVRQSPFTQQQQSVSPVVQEMAPAVESRALPHLPPQRKWWEETNSGQESDTSPIETVRPVKRHLYPAAFQRHLDDLRIEEERRAKEEQLYSAEESELSVGQQPSLASLARSEARSSVSSIRQILRPHSPSPGPSKAVTSKWQTPG